MGVLGARRGGEWSGHGGPGLSGRDTVNSVTPPQQFGRGFPRNLVAEPWQEFSPGTRQPGGVSEEAKRPPSLGGGRLCPVGKGARGLPPQVSSKRAGAADHLCGCCC